MPSKAKPSKSTVKKSKDIEQLELTISLQEEEIQKLRSEVQRVCEQRESTHKRLMAIPKNRIDAERTIFWLRRDLARYEENLTNTSNKCMILETCVMSANTSIAGLELQCKRKDSEIAQLTAENKRLKEDLLTKHVAVADMKTEINLLKKKLETVQADRNMLIDKERDQEKPFEIPHNTHAAAFYNGLHAQLKLLSGCLKKYADELAPHIHSMLGDSLCKKASCLDSYLDLLRREGPRLSPAVVKNALEALTSASDLMRGLDSTMRKSIEAEYDDSHVLVTADPLARLKTDFMTTLEALIGLTSRLDVFNARTMRLGSDLMHANGLLWKGHNWREQIRDVAAIRLDMYKELDLFIREVKKFIEEAEEQMNTKKGHCL
jgi:hypothetical protein